MSIENAYLEQIILLECINTQHSALPAATYLGPRFIYHIWLYRLCFYSNEENG